MIDYVDNSIKIYEHKYGVLSNANKLITIFIVPVIIYISQIN